MKLKHYALYVGFIGLLGSISYQVISADAKAAAKGTSKDEKAKTKTFTEEELKKAVQDELDKTLKKVSGSNMAEFSKELLQKEEALKVKELEIKKQEEAFKANIDEFEKRVKEFQTQQKKFLGCVDEQDQKADKRVSQMVEVISGMRPQNAADLLSVQDVDLAVKILGLLDPAKVSKIFNLMDKEISAKLQKQFMTMKK